jgi:hypothetical protein
MTPYPSPDDPFMPTPPAQHHHVDALGTAPTWWSQVLNAQLPTTSLPVRFALFVWVASLPSIVILANIVTKQFDELQSDHLLAEAVHYYMCSILWPVRPHSFNLECVIIQLMLFTWLCWSYLGKTRTSSITFRHLLPTFLGFATNSLMTWMLGIAHS